MSSLHSLPSLECAEYAQLSHFASSTGKISRQLSLPILSLRRPHGLPPLPPCPSLHGSCSHGVPFSPSCGYQHEGTSHRKLLPSRSMPAWSADYEGDYGLCAVTHSSPRKDSLGMEDSIVYRELCESIHLEVPGRDECMLSFPSVRAADRLCEGEEKSLDLSSSDARGRPMSLRMLKRRVSSKPSFVRQQVSGGVCPSLVGSQSQEGLTDSLPFDVLDSVNSAFASLVFMMESLQQHTVRLRRVLVSEADACLQVMMERVHQEVQETFLGLFQQVFACTPKLMLLTMMLLADFAVHSMGEHVALAVMPMGEPPTCAIERSVITSLLPFDVPKAAAHGFSTNGAVHHVKSSEPPFCEGGAGDGVGRDLKVGGGMDGDTTMNVFLDQAAMTSQDDTQTRMNDASDAGCPAILKTDNVEEHGILTAMWKQAVSKEVISGPLTNARHILVAPVRAPSLEADDYACYDRTDLNYQHEICRDPSNPLLLANYAQFLHVVRHDHGRAEELYKRAVRADPVDGELMGKYASFLWIAKEDVDAADEVYKTALAVDPSNAYHAGSYAHFLWNLGVDQDDLSTSSTAYHEASTS
ncbi:hypothetical protein GOP47_0005843 [Adiantum capillus-veneris]|uniref:Uncharacterized protein n=1 Tax=Adiantum capillus-veneris TaxID=13818 RepID=A0A9D4ZLZ3_ADICA|nr:hypothetical protein GOP47_0005843 [Adiantum capillus-veneris]